MASSHPNHLTSGLSPGGGARVVVGGDQEVAQVEVGVPVGGVVHVHVQQSWSTGGMGHGQARLLLGFTPGRVPRALSRFEVSSRLQPAVQALVHVQDRALGVPPPPPTL